MDFITYTKKLFNVLEQHNIIHTIEHDMNDSRYPCGYKIIIPTNSEKGNFIVTVLKLNLDNIDMNSVHMEYEKQNDLLFEIDFYENTCMKIDDYIKSLKEYVDILMKYGLIIPSTKHKNRFLNCGL